jgi:small subunit ribosomal protein S6
MKYYELMLIINGELSQEEASAEFEKFEQVVEKGNGKILKVDNWGLKRFAYPIKKKNSGYYYVVNLGVDYPLLRELERIFKINENLFRYLFVKLDSRKIEITEE